MPSQAARIVPPEWTTLSERQLLLSLHDQREAYACPFAGMLAKSGALTITWLDPERGDFNRLLGEVASALRDAGTLRSIAINVGPPPAGSTLEAHKRLFWRVLGRLSALDPVPWPASASRNLGNPDWTLFLAGVPVFALGTSPHYSQRASRRLTDTLTIVVQPLAIFRSLLPDRDGAQQAKASIRKRTNILDQQEAHPFLGGIEESSKHKIRQFLLPDDNSTAFDFQEIASLFYDETSWRGTCR